MAESIILHFRSTSEDDVFQYIAANAGTAVESETCSYPRGEAYLLLITPFRDYIVEYDEDEQAELECMLEARPSASMNIELRRSQSDAACDAVIELIRKLAVEFSFVVDDCYRFWRASEIVDGSCSLDRYRYAL